MAAKVAQFTDDYILLNSSSSTSVKEAVYVCIDQELDNFLVWVGKLQETFAEMLSLKGESKHPL